MIKRKVVEKDWYDPKWYDQAFSAVYEGIWLQSDKYSEIESKMLRVGYFPEEIPYCLYPNIVKIADRPDIEYPEFPGQVKYEMWREEKKLPSNMPDPSPYFLPAKQPAKRVDKKLSKERKHIKEIQSSLASEIAFARQRIQNFLKSSDIYGVDFDMDTPGYIPALCPVNKLFTQAESPASFIKRVEKLEKEYDVVIKRLNALTEEVRLKLYDMSNEHVDPRPSKDPRADPDELKKVSDEIHANLKAKYIDSWPRNKLSLDAAACIDDFDDYENLEAYASDEETTAMATKELQEELDAALDEQAKKPARTQYVLDVLTLKTKTNRDMMELTKVVRGIKVKGLRIRATKILNVQYGVRRLQVICVVDDEKLSLPDVKKILKERKDLVTRVEVVHIKKL